MGFCAFEFIYLLWGQEPPAKYANSVPWAHGPDLYPKTLYATTPHGQTAVDIQMPVHVPNFKFEVNSYKLKIAPLLLEHDSNGW